MRFVGLFLLVAIAYAQPCLIVKEHRKRASESFSRWTVPKPYDYVEGDFPEGMKFSAEVGNKEVRKIKEKGGKVVVLKDSYTLDELKDARSQCSMGEKTDSTK